MSIYLGMQFLGLFNYYCIFCIAEGSNLAHGKCSGTELYLQPLLNFILRQPVTKLPRLISNLGSSCLSLPSSWDFKRWVLLYCPVYSSSLCFPNSWNSRCIAGHLGNTNCVSQRISTFSCIFTQLMFIDVFVFAVAGLKPRGSCMLGKGSTTHLYPQPHPFLI